MQFRYPFKDHTVKAYWWRDIPNFGDAIAPLLLKRFADLDNVVWDTISHSSIASVGSILEHIPPLWEGYILGSGKLRPDSRLFLYNRRAKILALRGPLSAKGVLGTFALGDPGLLANELVGIQERAWDVGIVPHWKDKELADRFTSLMPKKYSLKVIKCDDDPLDIVRQIGQCGKIVTSSLHGAIVADSFGIPRRIEACEKMSAEGGLFKFIDYSASISYPLNIGVLGTPLRRSVEQRKFEIYDAYRELKGLLKK
jgi:pyruvyltransferase